MAFFMSDERELWQDYSLTDVDYQVDRDAELGKGGFGVVYKGTLLKKTRRNPNPPIAVAVKEALGPTDFKYDLSEISVLASFNHPCVMFMYGCRLQEKDTPTTILMPLMKTSLDKVINSERAGNPTPGWDGLAKSKCVFGVAAGLAYAHQRNVVHRDIKLDNIFLNADMEPCIGDYGVAKLFKTLVETVSLGNLLHKPPEVMGEEVSTTKADIYAYAIFLYELFAKPTVFEDGRRPASLYQLQIKLCQGQRWKRDPSIPEFYWDLINKCWDGSREKRPTALEICRYLRENRAKYAFDTSDDALAKLKEYEDRVMQGLTANDPLPNLDDDDYAEEEETGWVVY